MKIIFLIFKYLQFFNKYLNNFIIEMMILSDRKLKIIFNSDNIRIMILSELILNVILQTCYLVNDK